MPFKVGELLHQLPEMKGIICLPMGKKDSTIEVISWMLELGIGGNELLTYALIYGFSKDGQGVYFGSIPYLCAWLQCSRPTAVSVLKRLQEKGLVEKEETHKYGASHRCEYKAVIPDDDELKNLTRASKKSLLATSQKSLPAASKESLPYNDIPVGISHSSYTDSRDNNTPLPPFDFYKALINAGVTPETAEAWLVVRKAKRSVNSELAFRETMKEVRKSGRSAEECIRFSAARSWAGFMAQWLEREENGTGIARARKVDNITFMLEQRERRQAERARQQQGPSYDINDLPDEQ